MSNNRIISQCNRPYCEIVHIPQYSFDKREIRVCALYFHGEYHQYLNFIYFKHGSFIMTLEFLVTTTVSSEIESRTVDYSTCVHFDHKSYEGGGGDMEKSQQAQKALNAIITQTQYHVEISDDFQTMQLFDIKVKSGSKKQVNENFFIGEQGLLVFSFMSDKWDYTVNGGWYAFSPDSRCFVYINEWEDGDYREYPDVNILLLTSYNDYHWKQRRHFMLFLAGYGLLEVCNKQKGNGARNGKREELSIEKESNGGRLFFRVLYCANLLQQITFYL